ncbi:hypothetical protein QCA50_013806 [Cerrena zonata]|uniref:FAD-binding domain-containing protein n=1 Tax=Cerrena zonata TaxID=2478898 RepID=A0AAW0FZP2_9APHY
MSPTNEIPLHIAICGGGIGGLSLALVLQTFAGNKLLKVDLYEADAIFSEVGAGISVWHRTRYILRQLGAEEGLRNKAVSPPLNVRKSDMDEGFTFTQLRAPGNIGSTTLPRIELVYLLLERLSAGVGTQADLLTTHFSKRLTSYQVDSNGVILQFQDGSTTHADVLIGADGIGSPTRKTMYTHLAERVRATDSERAEFYLNHTLPIWTGIYVYRFLVDAERIRAVKPTHLSLADGTAWCAYGSHSVTYPISAISINASVCFNTPDGYGKPLTGSAGAPASKEEVVKLVKDQEDDLRLLAENAEDVIRWSLSQVRPLPQYVEGRVALLGDAAHAMIPFLGAGAGQAIEDAFILGHILCEPSVCVDNITEALKVYDEIRKPIARDVADRSLKMGNLMEFHPDFLPPDADIEKVRDGDEEHLKKIAEAMQDVWSFHYSKMPDEDWDRANARLGEVLGH